MTQTTVHLSEYYSLGAYIICHVSLSITDDNVDIVISAYIIDIKIIFNN